MMACKEDSAVTVKIITSIMMWVAFFVLAKYTMTQDLLTCGLDVPSSSRHNASYISVVREARMAEPVEDPKVTTLRAERCLNPQPESVVDEAFVSSAFMDARDLVQVKYEMVRRVRVDGMTISGMADAFGFSRPTFYEAAAALDERGLAGLIPVRPGPKRAHKLTREVVAFAQELLVADPSLRSVDVAQRIRERYGVRVHPRSVERALVRAEVEAKKGGSQ